LLSAFIALGGSIMPRKFLVALVAVAFLAAPTFVPASMTSLSGSALAQKPSTPTTDATNLNSSRSNAYRMGGGPGKPPTAKSGKTNPTGGNTNKTINLNTGRTN
jgi:hypothetical protein